jgi:hypothetical protein
MTDMRKCIGSAKFGIEAHEAPVGDFPVQPSQKDGLGRMCKPHWTEYTRALRKAALARKAAGGVVAEPTVQSQAAARVATKRAARVAAATFALPDPIRSRDALAPATVETLAVTVRRQKLDAVLAKVGVSTNAGREVLEAAAVEAARGRKLIVEAGEANVEEDGVA